MKDRLAIGIIEDAERRGTLKPGQTVVEATSGNTGIALAMVCAARGYPFVAVMPESFSVERRQIMRAYGAKVVLTPAAERGTGMVRKAARARRGARLVPRAPVREPGQPGLPPPDHRPRDPVRLRRQAARLLRHRLGHRRHADRRRPDDQARAARDQDRRVRAGRGRSCSTARRGSRTRSRAGRPTSCRRCSTARSSTSASRSPTTKRSRRARALAQQRGHLLRHLGGRNVRGRARGRGAGARRQRRPRDAARHRRALPVDRRCSRASTRAPT